jgi:hypothetical protein
MVLQVSWVWVVGCGEEAEVSRGEEGEEEEEEEGRSGSDTGGESIPAGA